MSKREYNDYRPEIIGMDWEPGNLILVASHSYGGKSQYVLGNCIVAGTKEKIPVAYFLPDGDAMRVWTEILRLQVGPQAFIIIFRGYFLMNSLDLLYRKSMVREC